MDPFCSVLWWNSASDASRKVGHFMNGWCGGLSWLCTSLQLNATWFVSAGYVCKAAGSRYPNSCREKLKRPVACWESRRIALRTPWSTASSSEGALVGRQSNSGSWQPCWQAVGENINWPFRGKVWGPNQGLGDGEANGDKLFGQPQRRGCVRRKDPSSSSFLQSWKWKAPAQRPVLANWNLASWKPAFWNDYRPRHNILSTIPHPNISLPYTSTLTSG